jgi:hypothetical protein
MLDSEIYSIIDEKIDALYKKLDRRIVRLERLTARLDRRTMGSIVLGSTPMQACFEIEESIEKAIAKKLAEDTLAKENNGG